MKKLLVIIPALNEEKTIGQVIDAIPQKIFNDVSTEAIVVNDGSNDYTESIAREHGAIVINHTLSRGVGASFWDGVKLALQKKADFVVNIDADGQMDPADIEKILKPIYDGVADMVTASRFLSSPPRKMSAIKRWGNNRVAQIVSYIVGKKFYDVSCGFRAYNKEALLWLNLHGQFTYTQETFINLAGTSHIRIVEIPVNIKGQRDYGQSRVASNIPKYAIRSGLIILSAFKDYRPIKFFGSLSCLFFILGCIFEAVFLGHYISTGYFRDYLFSGFVGAFLVATSMAFLILMIVSDTSRKMLQYSEELLYLNRKREYYKDRE